MACDPMEFYLGYNWYVVVGCVFRKTMQPPWNKSDFRAQKDPGNCVGKFSIVKELTITYNTTHLWGVKIIDQDMHTRYLRCPN